MKTKPTADDVDGSSNATRKTRGFLQAFFISMDSLQYRAFVVQKTAKVGRRLRRHRL